MKTQVVDKTGKKIEDITLIEGVFGVKPNDVLLAHYLRVFRTNQRQGNASTKSRGEVSGSGRKPWKQKGTGNARAGSKRSPLWRHGGVAHGPKPKDWGLDFPKRMRRLALLIALSQKQTNEKLIVIDTLKFKNPSTKDASLVLDNLKMTGKNLVILDDTNPDVIKSFNNIKDTRTAFWGNLNTFEILSSKNLLFTKDAILKIQEKYESK
ncbi:MAG: 50S ribosomal protein L4 [Patescibacteria group bacterium]|jgi:large subunit ribosomal protein L4